MNSHQRRKASRADMRKWDKIWAKHRVVKWTKGGITTQYEGLVKQVTIQVKLK
jgi:hypothetical protein